MYLLGILVKPVVVATEMFAPVTRLFRLRTFGLLLAVAYEIVLLTWGGTVG